MTYPTFMPTVAPSIGTEGATNPKTAMATFGDGYSQRSGLGLNAVQDTCNPVWTNLTTAQALALDNWFRGLGGYLPFYWQAPGDSVARLWYCPSWKRPWDNTQASSFQATFVECFDL